MRGEHDRPTRDPVAAGVDRQRLVRDVLDGGVLEDVGSIPVNRLQQPGEILARVEQRLVLEPCART
jgi:hypothetical protein